MNREELIELYWNKGLSIGEIAEIKGRTRGDVMYWMKKLNIPRRSKPEGNKMYWMRHPIAKYRMLFKPSSLAYILGVVLGDGWIHSPPNGRYRVCLRTTNLRFAEEFMRAIKDVGLNPHLRINNYFHSKNPNWSVMYDVVTLSKELYLFIKDMRGNLDKLRDFLINNGVVREFLKGFYEAEGSYTANGIRITNTDEEKIKLVVELLATYGFKTSIYSTKTKKDIYILGGRKEIDRFISWLNPCIKNSIELEAES